MREHVQQIAEPALSPAEWRNLGFRVSETNPVHGGYVTADPTPEPEYDMHYGLELGVVVRGRMRRLWHTWETELQPGEMWFCGMWERHGWQALIPGCQHFVLVLLPQFLLHARFEEAANLDWMAPFAAPPRDRPRLAEPARREILALLRRLELHLSTSDPWRAVSLELLALQLLLTVIGHWTPRRQKRPSVPQPHIELVSRAVEIALNSRRALSGRDVARMLGVSPSSFARSFHALMGITFARFALRSRIAQAANQLTHTRDSVEQVAADWGFAHVRQFGRSFSRHYGLTPATYRERRG